MSTAAILMMAAILGFVWGGFLGFILLALKIERKKEREECTETHR